MTGPLTRKIAIVTGAGQGAGLGVAEALADDGATVAVVGRTLSKLETVVEGIESFGGRRRSPSVATSDRPTTSTPPSKQVVTQFGTVDILVNAAHHNTRGGRLLDVDDDDVDLLWRTGPLATLRFMRACHPHLAGGGSIVNFGSGAQFAPEGLRRLRGNEGRHPGDHPRGGGGMGARRHPRQRHRAACHVAVDGSGARRSGAARAIAREHSDRSLRTACRHRAGGRVPRRARCRVRHRSDAARRRRDEVPPLTRLNSHARPVDASG